MLYPRWLFDLEWGIVLFSLLCLWPVYAAQLMLWRFTPRKKWIDTKVHMIYVGLVALVIETIRCPDMSAGFGRMSTMTQRLLYEQLGATLLCAVVLVMLATARSLYAQMSRPLPAIFPRLMWGIVAFYQLLIIPVLVGNVIATRDNDPDGLMFFWALNMWAWSGVSWLLLIVFWFLFFNLRKRVAGFVSSLEQQEARKKEAVSSAAASAAAVMAVQLLKRAAQDKGDRDRDREEQHANSQAQALALEEQRDDPVASPSFPSCSPLLLPLTPSEEQTESCSGDGVGKLSFPARVGSHLSVGRAPTLTQGPSTASSASCASHSSPSVAAQPGHCVPAPLPLPFAPSSSPPPPPLQRQVSDTPLSPSSAARSVAAQQQVRFALPRSSSNGSPARMVRPTLAQVAPAPAPAPAPSSPVAHVARPPSMVRTTSNGQTATAAGGAPGALAASPSTISISQSDARLIELYGALRKLNLMAALVTLLLLGTSCIQLFNLHRYASGETLPEVVRSPTRDRDGFPLLSGACTLLDIGSLISILWYAWSSPRVLSAESRRANGLRFWHTLLHGIDEAAAERYAPTPAENRKKNESVTGKRTSSWANLPQAATAAAATTPVAGKTIAGGAAAAPVAAATIAPSPPVTAHSGRNAW